jgi:hypothetical protein
MKITVSLLRDLLHDYDNEEMSISRFAEILNESAAAASSPIECQKANDAEWDKAIDAACEQALDESAASLPLPVESKWSDDDMKNCFEAGRKYQMGEHNEYYGGSVNKTLDFPDYLQSIKNQRTT